MNTFAKANKGIEKAVVTGYKAIETGVVSGYKAIENGVVSGYKKIEDTFVQAFAPTGEPAPQSQEEKNDPKEDEQ